MRITPDGYVGIGIAPTGGSYKLRGGGEGGVRAVVNGLNAIALHGESITGAGVVGNSTNGYGVLGTSTNSYAGYFSGNVYVTGTVTQNSDGA